MPDRPLVEGIKFLSPVQKEQSEAVRVPHVKFIEPFLPCQSDTVWRWRDARLPLMLVSLFAFLSNWLPRASLLLSTMSGSAEVS
jgi:hypothetical protein